ncbi:MAG TPA: stalk domain-containing protein [Bacillales bacterium]
MKKVMLSTVLMIIILLWGCSPAYSDTQKNISVYINGNLINYSSEPYIREGRTRVPLRKTIEIMDGVIKWHGNTRSVSIKAEGKNILLYINSTKAYVNKNAVTLDVAPVIVGDRTMIPIRFLSETIGYNVGWVSDTQDVVISNVPYIPILTYHNFTNKVANGANMPPDRFRNHMAFFHNHGYTTITLDDLLGFLNHRKPLPRKPLMITFDDGYESQYTVGYQTLKDMDMHGTIFAVVSTVGETPGSWPHFTWAQAREMENSGVIDVESHTYAMHHKINGKPALTHSSTQAIRKDLTTAKNILEQHLDKTVKALAYPYGKWNEKVKQIAVDTGYQGLFLFKEGIGVNFADQSPLMIDRFGVGGHQTARDIYEEILKSTY